MPALTREFCFDVDSQTASNDSALIRVEQATPKNVAGVSGHERPATTNPPSVALALVLVALAFGSARLFLARAHLLHS